MDERGPPLIVVGLIVLAGVVLVLSRHHPIAGVPDVGRAAWSCELGRVPSVGIVTFSAHSGHAFVFDSLSGQLQWNSTLPAAGWEPGAYRGVANTVCVPETPAAGATVRRLAFIGNHTVVFGSDPVELARNLEAVPCSRDC